MSGPHDHVGLTATLSREEIISGLRELVRRLREGGHPALIQIVGGAAIAMMHDASRRATRDVDGPLARVSAVRRSG